ncbi:hypothetical protein U1Q18_044690, partial [Sarracenia purpurea var. burkii]
EQRGSQAETERRATALPLSCVDSSDGGGGVALSSRSRRRRSRVEREDREGFFISAIQSRCEGIEWARQGKL